jgi:tRNA threonylcarbamoyladenosine biosynthesis protein TsaE
MFSRDLDSPEATQALGRRLGELAAAGTVLSLNGPLGAGKTCFAQGVGRGLGIEGPITSPTFILLASYPHGRLPFFHADYYRLGDESEFRELGLEEVIGREGLTLIEWADRFPDSLPADHLHIDLEDLGPGRRRFTAQAHGPQSSALLEALGV